MTTSGGIGGLPPSEAVDLDCPSCCGGSGGSVVLGVGGQELSTTPPPTELTGGSTSSLVVSGGLVATITNPNAANDIWVEVALDLGSYRLNPGLAYQGRLAWQAQAVNSGPFTVPAPIISGEGSRDGLAPGGPYFGEMHMELPQVTFGFLLLAGATETVSVESSIRLQDDGVYGLPIGLSVLSLPRLSYVGTVVS